MAPNNIKKVIVTRNTDSRLFFDMLKWLQIHLELLEREVLTVMLYLLINMKIRNKL